MSSSKHVFTAAAPYYNEFRVHYPPALFDALLDALSLGPGHHAIDVGAGTGEIAFALASHGLSVLGLEPNDAMRAIAQETLDGAPLPVTLSDRPAQALTHEDGPASLVTFGRSFHWLNHQERAQVLSLLDEVITPTGGVAIMSEDAAKHRQELESLSIVEALRLELFPPKPDAPERIPHEVFLRRSAFAHVTTLRVSVEHTRSVDQVIGQALSTSALNPARLGERLDYFQETLCERLLDAKPGGIFHERYDFIALLATRSPLNIKT